LTEVEAKSIIEKIANEVRQVAVDKRFQRMIQLMLESFAPDHVLTELLQNANDVKAKTVKITLTDTGILFTHNGQSFTEANLKALCDVGESTKKPGTDIGFMGIGFKATFKVADTVLVFSKPYQFCFNREEVIVPHWLDEVPLDLGVYAENCETSFYLPFRRDLPIEIVESIKKTASTTLEPLCLVFLKNIEKIEVVCGKNSRILMKTRGGQNEAAQHFSIVEKTDAKERIFNYFVFRKSFDINPSVKSDYRAKDSGKADLEKTTITIAFTLKDGNVEPAKSVLYTFLPTPFETGLRFAVNADFLLNTQRTEVDLVSRWNIWLFASLSDFLRQIITEFAHDNEQKFFFYEVLPRKRELPEWLFKKIGEPIIEYIKKTPIVLTSTEKLALPSQVVLASEAVQKLIPPEKANSQYYAHPKLRGKVFLRDELGIQDLDESNLERSFVLNTLKDKIWLSSLDANGTLQIYEYLYDRLYGKGAEQWNLSWIEQNGFERELRNLEIVRSREGHYFRVEKVVLPVSSQNQDEMNDLPGIVLTIPDPEVLSIKSLDFLRKLGARDFSQDYAVNQILDSQAKGNEMKWTEEEKLKSIRYISRWLELKNYQVQSDFKTKLYNLFLPIEKNGWSPAAKTYFPNPELKVLLPNSIYVDLDKLKTNVQNVQLFLSAVGVPSYPRVLMIGEMGIWSDPSPSILKPAFENYRSWLYEQKCYNYYGRDHKVDLFVLDGFDSHVVAQDPGALLKYMEYLLDHWQDYYNSFVNSTFCWFYYTDNRRNVPSYFTYQLKASKWIPTAKGYAAPGEVFAPLREIKKVGGNLLQYLRISEEKARDKKEFLEFLGIKTQISLSLLLSILYIIKNENVTEELKSQLCRIYSRLVYLCEDELIGEEVYILNKKNVFQPAKTLYWLDDPETENVFGEDIPAVWVPDGLTRLQLKALFNALGVKEVSLILERNIPTLSPEAVQDDHLKIELRKKGDYINSVLLHCSAGKIELLQNFLKQLVVIKENHLKVQLKILDKVHEVETPCFCSLEEKKMYVSSIVQMTDVARELARVFDASTGSEFAIGFVLTQPPEAVDEQLRRSSIQVVRLAEPFELKPEVEETLEPAQTQTTASSESEITVENTIIKQLEPTINTLDLTVRQTSETETLPNSHETEKQNVPNVDDQSSAPRPTVTEPPPTVSSTDETPTPEPQTETSKDSTPETTSTPETPPEQEPEEPGIEPPPTMEPPPEEPPQRPLKTTTEINLRDSAKANWVKRNYSYNCQICLSKEEPATLTYPKSYASVLSNRRIMIEAHHVKEIVKGEGHDHVGNIISLCRYHHNWFNQNLFDIPLLSIIQESLNNITEKDIIWPDGQKTTWKLMNCKVISPDGQPLQIIFTDSHLSQIERYLQFIVNKR